MDSEQPWNCLKLYQFSCLFTPSQGVLILLLSSKYALLIDLLIVLKFGSIFIFKIDEKIQVQSWINFCLKMFLRVVQYFTNKTKKKFFSFKIFCFTENISLLPNWPFVTSNNMWGMCHLSYNLFLFKLPPCTNLPPRIQLIDYNIDHQGHKLILFLMFSNEVQYNFYLFFHLCDFVLHFVLNIFLYLFRNCFIWQEIAYYALLWHLTNLNDL